MVKRIACAVAFSFIAIVAVGAMEQKGAAQVKNADSSWWEQNKAVHAMKAADLAATVDARKTALNGKTTAQNNYNEISDAKEKLYAEALLKQKTGKKQDDITNGLGAHAKGLSDAVKAARAESAKKEDLTKAKEDLTKAIADVKKAQDTAKEAVKPAEFRAKENNETDDAYNKAKATEEERVKSANTANKLLVAVNVEEVVAELNKMLDLQKAVDDAAKGITDEARKTKITTDVDALLKANEDVNKYHCALEYWSAQHPVATIAIATAGTAATAAAVFYGLSFYEPAREWMQAHPVATLSIIAALATGALVSSSILCYPAKAETIWNDHKVGASAAVIAVLAIGLSVYDLSCADESKIVAFYNWITGKDKATTVAV